MPVVTLDDCDTRLRAGEAVDVPVGTAHRISNPGKAALRKLGAALTRTTD